MKEENAEKTKPNYNMPLIIFLTAFAIFGILGTVYSVYQSRQLEKEVAKLRNN
jgi:uncharacterized integral membrane protein